MPIAEMVETELKLTLISGHAKRVPKVQFTSLAHLLDADFLKVCFYSLNRNKARGVDNVSWYDYEKAVDKNLEDLVDRMKRRKFKPIAAKRVYIPKEDGKKRPLGISAMENKIVEKGITRVLQTIYEEDFYDFSYGFRPGRNCHQALKALDNKIMMNPVNHIVEADIKGFFDNVSHKELMKFLEIRIKDTPMQILIRKFLKAGYIDNNLFVTSEKGTPQGSILSPLLANIFLHYVLDDWFEREVKSNLRGYAEIIRYADDFVCLVRYQEDAKLLEQLLKERFLKFSLEIHPEKSQRLSFGRYERENAKRQNRGTNTFDFLGFTHFCDKSRAGYFKVGRKTSRKKFNKKAKEMTMYLKRVRNQSKAKDWWEILKAKLRGHYQYYGVSDNYKSISSYYNHTIRMLFKWLNRRSQKKSMNWTNFIRYLELYPLPKPKIVHNLYRLSVCS